jgi:hypothetical protein
MAFVWRGDQLFTKRGSTNDGDDVWTTFLMDMRNPIDVNIITCIAAFNDTL